MTLVLQTSHNRAEFFANNLGSFGRSLVDALTPRLPAKLTFQGKVYEIGSDKLEDGFDPFNNGFSSPRVWAEGCLGWIWCQWLDRTPPEIIEKQVEFVVERGMEMQRKSSDQNYRCLHDLWLLNCAALASSESQLLRLARSVVDSKGDRQAPRNNGELFAAAWCGTLKHWILGDLKQAEAELKIVGTSYRYDIAKLALKPMAAKWLAGNWKGFAKEQQKDFTALWERLTKYRLAAPRGENEIVIQFDRLGVPGTGWCWSHCGLAMLAHRRGHPVITDPFWFPPHALKCVEQAKPI